jgi:Tfp pilus assembly protein PilO
MMRTAHADRLWAIGGAVAAVAMLAVGWFFLIGPQYEETSRLRDDAVQARSQLPALQHRLVELRKQNEDLPQYLAQLERDRRALPTTAELSDFLRELQMAGDAVGVAVSGLTVGAPTQVTAGGTQAYALPINLTAGGTTAKLNQFLDQLQQVQQRAVLINNASIAPSAETGSLGGAATLSLNLQVFVAPPAGAGSAQPSATPS